MRALIQRVSKASVTVDGAVVGRCAKGALILICAMQGDSEASVHKLAGKIPKLRIYKDENGKMNRSLLDEGGEVLLVSQFTLAAETSRGNRPGFSAAAPPAEAERLYLAMAGALRAQGIKVETGQFGADMQVALCNDGPVTIWMDTEAS